MMVAALSAIALAFGPSRVHAQGYYNLDGGRPGRVEDASPSARYELELQLLPVRFEQLASGPRRWRTDPKLSFGVSPFTELELRVPFLVVDPRTAGVPATSGIAGLAIGGLHALTLETGRIPALAIAGEWSAPVGGLAAPVGSWSAKVLATKTFPVARVHANVGYGSWSVRPGPALEPSCSGTFPGGTPPPGCVPPPPNIPDTPCARAPASGAQLACVAATSAIGAASTSRSAVAAASTVGSRWVAAIGADHAFALSSTLVAGGLVAERYIGLYDAIDWSAELGVRRQLTPQLVFDAGVTRHFFQAFRSNAITVGFTYDLPLQPFHSARGAR